MHTGSPIEERPGALARTDGYDIHLAPGAPGPATADGEFLLAHEAAHVIQQTAAGPTVQTETAEAEADHAAVAALQGRRPDRLSPSRGPHYFEARLHQATLVNAMETAGFTDAEQREAYWTNWCRDVSQAFVPIVVDNIGAKATMTLLQTISQAKFGKPVPPSIMGMYEPRQHIDNPAGQINADLLQTRQPEIALGPGAENTLSGQQDDLDPAAIGRKFALNASGVPAYIADSRGYIDEQLDLALEAGRSPAGLHAIGNVSHTIEDLFAHSNWIEIAVGHLIERKTIQIPPGPAGSPAARVTEQIRERSAARQPVIETYAAEVRDSVGNVRPILQTGTFSGGMSGNDTLVSLKAEATNLLRANNPYLGPGGSTSGTSWELVEGVLQAFEDMSSEAKLGGLMEEALQLVVDSATAEARRGLAALPGAVTGASVRGVSLGDIPGVSWAANQAARLGEAGVDAAEGLWADELRAQVGRIVNAQKGLRIVDAANYLKNGVGTLKDDWADLKTWIADHVTPVIARPLLAAVTRAENAFKEKLNAVLARAWTAGVDALMAGVGRIAVTDVAETSVAQKHARFMADLAALKQSLRDGILAAVPGEEGQNLVAEMDALVARVEAASDDAGRASAGLRVLAGFVSSDRFVQAVADAGVAQDVMEVGGRDGILRAAQLDALPEWARQGGSHSQVAKDHADSPFFGVAYTVANHADTTVVTGVVKAWKEQYAASARGQGRPPDPSAPAAGLEADFDPTTPGVDHEGVSEAEEERRRAFRDNKDMGAYILQQGHTDELMPVLALDRTATSLEEFLASRASERERHAGRHGGTAPPDPAMALLLPVIAGARVPETRTQLTQRVATAREGLLALSRPDSHDWKLANEVEPMLLRVERQARQLTHECTPGESALTHRGHAGAHSDDETSEGHAHHADEEADQPEEASSRTEVHYQEQINALNRMRGKQSDNSLAQGPVVGDATFVDPKAANKPADRAVAQASTAEQELRARVAQIFGHPYDTNWWQPIVAQWCTGHMDLLVQYIDERNRGVAHHQH
ncbi:MAG: DUF4157 domain-containing protein [Actinomycetales bacterium]|nr:DUF4157 domain-containing protein [Actinomycetales bacterium]